MRDDVRKKLIDELKEKVFADEINGGNLPMDI
jgi:hypothetical protein